MPQPESIKDVILYRLRCLLLYRVGADDYPGCSKCDVQCLSDRLGCCSENVAYPSNDCGKRDNTKQSGAIYSNFYSQLSLTG